MTYREHVPPVALRPWLECLWERTADGSVARVVPDGCIDVLWIEGAGTRVVGPNRTAFLVDLPAGTRALGARFHPGTAPALLGVHAAALCDAQVGIEVPWGDDGRRLAERLDHGDRARVLTAAIAQHARRSPAPDALVRAAVDRLGRPGATIAAIARELAVSERQLRRRTHDAVGYGPKRLARVLRLRGALAAAHAGDELARVAHEAGYADQAHFANDCRELAGASPTVLVTPSMAVSSKTAA